MNKRGQAGFTLIELLVGLTLLGLTVTMIVAALNTGLLGADATAKRSERLSQIRAAQSALRGRIEAARPVAWGDRVGFDGQRAALSFVAILPPWPDQGGPHLIRIERDGDRLVLSGKIHSGETKSFDFADPVRRTVLLSGVRTVRFGYYGRASPLEPAKWHETWDDRAVLPSLVRLSVEFAGDTGTSWPDLLVAPAIGPQPR